MPAIRVSLLKVFEAEAQSDWLYSSLYYLGGTFFVT